MSRTPGRRRIHSSPADSLLRSIREVLGAEIATGEVLAAWGAAYQQLAELLISRCSRNGCPGSGTSTSTSSDPRPSWRPSSAP
ncbi:hypothetical protein [Cystobacter fuscus]|uniref:hypothetical protein n=1 Tax=Cystobacter fuscus TaxID=43 RepID=UPI0018E0257F|nr:hypothetical protein [Cystobacter fuscus]